MENKSIYLLAGILLLMTACTKIETVQVNTPGAKTVADVLKNNFSFSLFYSAVKKAGLEQQLTTDSVTVLVPDNTAMGRMNIFSDTVFNGWDVNFLKRWVQYHIVTGKVAYNDVPQTVDNKYYTLGNEVLYISKRVRPTAAELLKKIMHVNGDTVNTFDITADNGMLHVLAWPLKVPVQPTVQAYLNADTTYSLFVTALKKFGLYDQLNQEGPFTILAPVNAAFRSSKVTADSIAKLDTLTYKKILFGCYVFTPNRFFISDFGDAPGIGNGPANMNNYFYTPDVILNIVPGVSTSYAAYSTITSTKLGPGNTTINAAIVNTDNLTGNGVVHQVINNLVLYPKDMLK